MPPVVERMSLEHAPAAVPDSLPPHGAPGGVAVPAPGARGGAVAGAAQEGREGSGAAARTSGTAAAGRGAGADRRAAERRAAQRAERVAAGLAELERWLADRVRRGIADSRASGPGEWDELARRLVDAQAPGVAGAVSRLTSLLARDDWPSRLLEEYALLNLLAVGYRRGVDGPLGETIRARVGFTTTKADVLAGERVRDEWHVIGRRDSVDGPLLARRVWLRGRRSGRAALMLSFAPAAEELDDPPATGAVVDAELAFYPGASPLRVQVADRWGTRRSGAPPGTSVVQAQQEVAAALAGDPWTDSWPVVLSGVVPLRGEDGWLLGHPPAPSAGRDGEDGRGGEADADGAGEAAGWALDPRGGTPLRLIAVSGGEPVTVSAEWTPYGLTPLAVWAGPEDEAVTLP
ncbi:hypothetical protein SAMN04489764_4824 [Thermostaphylospora chromogena]|uniref:SWIM zinc finger n=1 Tax=Thermostaphylospora chromogena TaxID=35622 RepID=A0A1H1HU24_9ACTN|nr:hypothetical protein SAMN04489764_4824 [Thermostaphylospora chromogena]